MKSALGVVPTGIAAAVVSALVACTSADATDPVEAVASTEAELFRDVTTIVQRPDGKFNVTCSNGTAETGLSLADLQADRVCNGSPSSSGVRLVCKTDSSGKAAIYNMTASRFIDSYYSKSVADCNRTIRASLNDLTCATDSSGKAAIYNYKTNSFEDSTYSRTLDDCIGAIQAASTNPRLACKVSSDGKAAIYDRQRSAFVDAYYSKTTADCARTIAASLRGLTCATDSSGKAAVYDYENGRFVDDYYSKTLDECIDSVR